MAAMRNAYANGFYVNFNFILLAFNEKTCFPVAVGEMVLDAGTTTLNGLNMAFSFWNGNVVEQQQQPLRG